MDKTLHRDLENLCWRLSIYQCNLVREKILESSKEAITQKDIIDLCSRELNLIDKIIFSISRFTISGFMKSLGFLETLEGKLGPRDSINKEDLIKNLIELRNHFKSKINNEPIK